MTRRAESHGQARGFGVGGLVILRSPDSFLERNNLKKRTICTVEGIGAFGTEELRELMAYNRAGEPVKLYVGPSELAPLRSPEGAADGSLIGPQKITF